jgi:hypothetical protein
MTEKSFLGKEKKSSRDQFERGCHRLKKHFLLLELQIGNSKNEQFLMVVLFRQIIIFPTIIAVYVPKN